MATNGMFAGQVIDDEPGAGGAHGETWQDACARARRTAKRVRRSGAASGDVRVPRDTPPRTDLLVFTDEPGSQMSNRRKRTRLNKGGIFLQPRDRQIVWLVAAHGWLDIRTISALTGSSVRALRHRLRLLVTHNLLDDSARGLYNQILYRTTSFGLRRTGTIGFNSPRPSLQSIEHSAALAALHIQFGTADRDGWLFITEREIYAAQKSGRLSPRILESAPWAAGYTGADIAAWTPSTVNDKGKKMWKRPDGLVLRADSDGRVLPPQAVEIERNEKKPREYLQVALMYAKAAADGALSPVVTYFAPAGTVGRRVERNLNAVYSGGVKEYRWPAHLPRIRWDVRVLDTFHTDFAARRGWTKTKKES